jgi:23S rRNA (cytidine1920-2'-O)/16S rRNA (cytidine1409-2'-O)-methyltransferase
VAPALARCTLPGADLVVLVKPQFEAGRARVGKGGVVRDPDVHRAVLRETRDALESHELVVVGAAASPLRGADGNVEFFFHARRTGDGAAIDDRVDDAALDAVVASVAPPVNAGSSA